MKEHPNSTSWPSPPFEVVLVEPEIPPNTGNIARVCAATGSPLHLVGPLGFRVNDKEMKRAGLDYWDAVDLTRHRDLETFLPLLDQRPFHLFSTRGERLYTEVDYEPGDLLIFGSETRGLPEGLLEKFPDRVTRLPMQTQHVRSLNLSNTVAIALYEALRQTQRKPFAG